MARQRHHYNLWRQSIEVADRVEAEPPLALCAMGSPHTFDEPDEDCRLIYQMQVLGIRIAPMQRRRSLSGHEPRDPRLWLGRVTGTEAGLMPAGATCGAGGPNAGS